MPQGTKLLYLEDPDQVTCEADVLSVLQEAGKEIVILDATVFYPQGGGQPCDRGVIASASSRFRVESVRSDEARVVRHIGRFEGPPFAPGSAVRCAVDAERRSLHARLHSAGHVVDIAVRESGLPWAPVKGYHFPEGPYVEYAGSLEGQDKEKVKEKLRASIEEHANAIVREARPRRLEGEAIRTVFFGDAGAPCGGTHVSDTGKIGPLKIRKVKAEGARVRVAYALA